MRTATTRRTCGAIPCSRWRSDRSQPAEEAVADLRELDLDVIAFDRAQGEAAGRLRSATRQAGLSLGGLPPVEWLSRPLRGSCRKENTPAEQVEAGATVHLPLDQLEPGDLPLRLAAAPGRRERRPDRGAVLLQPSRKGLKSAHPARSGVGQPGGQRHARRLRADLRIDPTPAHEGRQPAGQPGNVRSRRVLLDPRHEGCIRPRQRRRGLDEQPSELRG